MFHMGRQQTMDMLRASQAHTVANLVNTVQGKNTMHKDRCHTIHSMSME